jgi:TRAP-type C4-dicarboxylate transport system permease small subunit
MRRTLIWLTCLSLCALFLVFAWPIESSDGSWSMPVTDGLILTFGTICAIILALTWAADRIIQRLLEKRRDKSK